MAVQRAAIEAGLGAVGEAPAAAGVLLAVVRRPEPERREMLEAGELDTGVGLVGDCWATRGSSRTADGSANPDAQLTLMGARAIELLSGSLEHRDWAPAGDQLFVDLDLSVANLPTGARLGIGAAVLEVSAEPHLGCGKFARRYGVDALKAVNSEAGRAVRLRGLNARVLSGGPIAVGEPISRID